MENIFDLDYLIKCFNEFSNRKDELIDQLYTKLYTHVDISRIAFLATYLCSNSKVQEQYRDKALKFLSAAK